MSDLYPKDPKYRHRIDEMGRAFFKVKMPLEWQIKFNSETEYGTDFETEISFKEEMQGISFKGQLKTHKRPIRINKDNTISEYIYYKNWNRWIKKKFFLLVVVDITQEKIYWINIRDYKIMYRNKEGESINIPITNEKAKKDTFNQLIYEIFKVNDRNEEDFNIYMKNLYNTYYLKKKKKSYRIKSNFYIEPFYYNAIFTLIFSLIPYLITQAKYPILINIFYIVLSLIGLKLLKGLRNNYKTKKSKGLTKLEFISCSTIAVLFLLYNSYITITLFLNFWINIAVFGAYIIFNLIFYFYNSMILNRKPNPKALKKSTIKIVEEAIQ